MSRVVWRFATLGCERSDANMVQLGSTEGRIFVPEFKLRGY
jgi:hypothetical protein